MKKINKYTPVYTYTASLTDGTQRYKYIVDGNEEPFTRSLDALATTTFNEFFGRKDTVKVLPEFNHPDKGSWTRSIGKTPLFDDSYIPTVHLYGENANKTFHDTKPRYINKTVFILKDDIVTLTNAACYTKNKSWPKFQFRLVTHEKTLSTAGVYGRYVLKFRDNNEDPTFFRQKLYSDIMDTIGVPTIQTIFARVYVNEVPVGLYVLQEEAASESFVRSCFHGDNNGHFLITDIDSLGHPLDCSTGADIAYGEGVHYGAFQPYNKTRYDNKRVKKLAKALYDLDIDNDIDVDNFNRDWFDIDSFFKAVAMEYLTGHWDSYLFYSTNYAMYDDPTQSTDDKYKFYFICQDWDMTFGVNLGKTYTRYDEEFLTISYKKYVNIEWGIDSNDAPRRFALDKLLLNENNRIRFEQILTDIVRYILNPKSFEPRLSAFIKRFRDEVEFSYTTTPWRSGSEIIKWDMGDFDRNLNYRGRYGVSYGLREFVCKRAKGINEEFNLGLNINCSKYEHYKECGSGYGYCHDNKCCSKSGYCGITEEYCGNGCQIEYGICGIIDNLANNSTDIADESIDRSGNLDTYTTDNTNNNNQNVVTNGTNANSITSTTSTNNTNNNNAGVVLGNINSNIKCGPMNNNNICPDNECCSENGTCGITSLYCGKGCQIDYGRCDDSQISSVTSTLRQANIKMSKDGKCGPKNNNTICPNNKCCSKYGYCGTTSTYCDKGCQIDFGRCN